MRIGVIGATGFIGKEFCKLALSKGHEVVGYSRSSKADENGMEWREFTMKPDFSGLDAIVNYAGESVAQRWNEQKKELFIQSRVGVTDTIVSSLAKMKKENRPKALFNASGVGFYGDSGSDKLDEESERGAGYLSDLCLDWENAAFKAEELGLRVVVGRIGLVLGEEGEAWKKMYTTFKVGLGGQLGSGKHWMPWVDVKDVAGGTLHSLESEIGGAVNLVSPSPMTNVAFTKSLAQSLGKPAMIPVPEFGLWLLFGEFGKHILDSNRVYPAVLSKSKYQFVSSSLLDFLER